VQLVFPPNATLLLVEKMEVVDAKWKQTLVLAITNPHRACQFLFEKDWK